VPESTNRHSVWQVTQLMSPCAELRRISTYGFMMWQEPHTAV
jgi:hypothetical protein